MKYLNKLIFLIILISSITFAQNKKFTLEDVVFNSTTTLAPSTLKQLQWVPNEYSYSYVEKAGDSDILVKGFATSGKREDLISLKKLSDKILSYSSKVPKSFPQITWFDEYNFHFNTKDKIYNYSWENDKLTVLASLPLNSENIFVSPDGIHAAFTKNNNLYVSVDDKNNKQITYDDGYNITNGITVSRECFGITKGIFWSPKGNYVAFYSEDLSEVTDYPLVDISTTPATLKNIKYPMAGQNSQVVKIGIYNLKTEKTIWLKTDGEKNQYLTSVTWGPGEEYIYTAQLNRDQNHLRLVKYDAADGTLIKVLFEEESAKYVEPEHPLYFLPKDPTKFIWFSERDGWNHLYLYNTKGELLKQLTFGNWVVTKLVGIDKKSENLFVVGTKDSPVERHLYKINFLNSRAPKKLTADVGTHRIMMHNSGLYFIDQFSSLTVPNEISILNNKGEGIGLIHVAENPIKDYAVGKTDIFTIKAADDSTDLYCRMIYPPNFDTTKTYPVIVYVYGGPHVQLVNNKWNYGKYAFWFKYMAQHDYILFTVDSRGSDNRGINFEQATFRNLGTVEIADQLKGIEYLKSKSFVDPERIGVYGWSYGGFMTTSLMTRTDAFKVGVAGGAVIDWDYYEVMYTERYMDTPQTNFEGYSKANLLNYIPNLKGKKLLQLHGTMDPVVVWQNTLQYAKKAADENIPLDYYPYPGHEHHVLGKDMLNLYTKISNYFLDNL